MWPSTSPNISRRRLFRPFGKGAHSQGGHCHLPGYRGTAVIRTFLLRFLRNLPLPYTFFPFLSFLAPLQATAPSWVFTPINLLILSCTSLRHSTGYGPTLISMYNDNISPTQLFIFSSDNSFNDWKKQINPYLMAKGYWDLISGDDKEPKPKYSTKPPSSCDDSSSTSDLKDKEKKGDKLIEGPSTLKGPVTNKKEIHEYHR